MRGVLVLAVLLALAPMAAADPGAEPRIGPGCGELDPTDPNSVACWAIFLPLALACTAVATLGGPPCPG